MPYFLRNLIPSSRNEVARGWVGGGGGGFAFNVFLSIFSDQPFVLNMSVHCMPYEFNICTGIFTIVKLKVWLTLNCLFHLDKQIVKKIDWFTICLFKFLCKWPKTMLEDFADKDDNCISNPSSYVRDIQIVYSNIYTALSYLWTVYFSPQSYIESKYW